MSVNDFLDLLQYRFYEMKPNVSENYNDQKKNKNTTNFFYQSMRLISLHTDS